MYLAVQGCPSTILKKRRKKLDPIWQASTCSARARCLQATVVVSYRALAMLTFWMATASSVASHTDPALQPSRIEQSAEREYASAEMDRISRTELSFGEAPSVDELCAFGHALPRQLVTISITGPQRIERVRNHFKRMCLPNAIIVDGVVFRNVSEISRMDRQMLGRDNLNSRSLGELAITVAHYRALERCLAEQRDEKAGCLIMEDDFTLTGPRLAERWTSSFAVLQQQPDWHLLFLGRCMDGRCGQLRVSQNADLYRSPQRNISMGEKWDGSKWDGSTPMCLHSYMVTPEGAKRLLVALRSSDWIGPADWAPAAIAADSNIFTISPALITQSTALRLDDGSGSVLSKADAQRDVAETDSNTLRPPIVGECMPNVDQHDMAPLPRSSQVPWLLSTGGPMHRALYTSFKIAIEGQNTSGLSACEDLPRKLTQSGAAELLKDSEWQPGPEAIDAGVYGCALQLIGSSRAMQKACAASPVRTEYRCPLVGELDATGASEKLTRVGCIASRAFGYNPNHPNAQAADDRLVQVQGSLGEEIAVQQTPDEVVFQETAGYLRPSVCSYRVGSRMNYQLRHKRKRVLKMVNDGRALEFRPILKAGSTFLGRFLRCLQPGEWREVKQSQRLPADYTALVVVRDPIRRFVSAHIEIMRRIFSGACPEGPCNEKRDSFYTSAHKSGAPSTALWVAETASWFRHALRFYKGEVLGHQRPQVLREMLTAVVTDTSCLLNYYASEHFMTQMQLASQGTALDPTASGATVDRATFLKIEDIGTTSASIAASQLLPAIGASPSRKQLDQCVQSSSESDIFRNYSATAIRGGPSGFNALPEEGEMYTALMEEPALLLVLCQVYAQDSACLSAQYEAPNVCQQVLGLTA